MLYYSGIHDSHNCASKFNDNWAIPPADEPRVHEFKIGTRLAICSICAMDIMMHSKPTL